MIIGMDEMKKYGCLLKTKKCDMLKILKIKDIDGEYRAFYNCVSEERLCCGCCKRMKKIPADWKRTTYWRLLK
jgi:hypothetical protein